MHGGDRRPAERRDLIGVVVAEDQGMPAGLEPLQQVADVRLARGETGLEETVRDADILFVWEFRRDRLASVWSQARNLRWVHAASAGVDAVNVPELVERDVVITNTRGVLDDAIAEWVLGVLLLFVKDLHTTLRLQRSGRWHHRDSERLAGRQLLVVGAGSIGRAVARLCRAAGMRVEGVASHSRPGDPDFERVVGSEDLRPALAQAEFVVLCVPLTADTHGLIGEAELAALPEGARLVNVSRGPVVDETALLAALRSGGLAGAALDVFAEEPLPPDHPFWVMDQVVVSPHMAGDFAGWEEAFSAVFLDNYGRWSRREPLVNIVDTARLLPPVTSRG